ncbi:hypothetical protein UFOVP119_46 [uncultured Caudovirales phage]|uniref:Uncharacterized protein n=1 Tax=uncultured Caudovirales phage TaxID=2100421 RepID=A0A6J5LAH9_9CAUD|nr:hypothetical protein UFOVP119_46 [uncultured Caudovirales phage]
MKRVPSTFQLLAHTITVTVIEKRDWKWEDAVAYWNPANNTIELMRQPRTIMRHAFWHEVAHAVLDMMGQTKLSRNEVFVDAMGGLLAQMMDTAQ